MTTRLSIITPIAPNDESSLALLAQYAELYQYGALSAEHEIILVCSDQDTLLNLQNKMAELADNLPANCHLLHHQAGRAACMNAGAAKSTGEFLWFVHADTMLQAPHLLALEASISRNPDALHYFDLGFDGPWMMGMNALGVWLRCRLFGCPFGDQALCISRIQFDHIGAYSETAPYGEDHLLVWQHRRHKGRLQPVKPAIQTSARKYIDQGWAAVTGRHLLLWMKQAWPQWRLLRKGL